MLHQLEYTSFLQFMRNLICPDLYHRTVHTDLVVTYRKMLSFSLIHRTLRNYLHIHRKLVSLVYLLGKVSFM